MWRRSPFPAGRHEDGRDATSVDATLVDAAAAGSEDAFAELFRRHGVDVITMVQRRSGSAAVADDVTAIAFERAWRSLPALRDRGVGFRPWVFRVAVNELIDLQRSASRRVARERRVGERDAVGASSGDPAIDAGIDEPDIGGVSASELRAAISSLTDAQQEIITLRFFADMEPAEIAMTLGIAKGTVGVRTHRAIAALRTRLGAQRTEEGPS